MILNNNRVFVAPVIPPRSRLSRRRGGGTFLGITGNCGVQLK